MGKDGDIKRYSADELRELRARRGSQTDMTRVLATTDEELERQIADDPDWRGVPADWYENAVPIFASRDGKCLVELDGDIVEWFRRQRPDYPREINAVLRAYVEHRKRGQA